MPFHPWCFDIFSRCSKLRLGYLAIDGLTEYRKAKEGFTVYCNPTRKEKKENPWSRGVYWEHRPGSEFSAANPLEVEYLEKILTGAVKAGRKARNLQRMESDSTDEQATATAMTADASHGGPARRRNCLQGLPQDVRLKIIENLDMTDVKSLRLVSKGFEHQPDEVWCRMLREDMPWLFEAWDAWSFPEHTRSIWTWLTVGHLSYLENYAKRESPIEYGGLIKDFLYPSNSRGRDQVRDRPIEKCQFRLPTDKDEINWRIIYTSIKRYWYRLKGLRNRKRIWDLVDPMVHDMKDMLSKPTPKV